jgi:hypothetical protein
MEKVKNTRWWCFTNFKLEFNYEKYLEETSARYVCYGLEICPTTGRPHHQGWVYFSGARGSYKGVAKQLGKCRVAPCLGNMDQNNDYCSKEADLISFGVKPAQGERKDLDEIKNGILEGTVTVDEITVQHPNVYHQYGRTLNKLEEIAFRKKFRTWMTEGLWLWGTTGVGKSHRAFEGFSPETHYVLPDDRGWWDGYTGQETVIVNEFGDELTYTRILDLVDKWPCWVPQRGKPPVPFLAKKLIVTSSCEPCYAFRSNGYKPAEFERRFKIVNLKQKWSEGNIETSD